MLSYSVLMAITLFIFPKLADEKMQKIIAEANFASDERMRKIVAEEVAKANLIADERMRKIVAEEVAKANLIADEKHAKFYEEMRKEMRSTIASIQMFAQIAISRIEASEEFVQCVLEIISTQGESETMLLDQLHMLGERKYQLITDLIESQLLII